MALQCPTFITLCCKMGILLRSKAFEPLFWGNSPFTKSFKLSDIHDSGIAINGAIYWCFLYFPLCDVGLPCVNFVLVRLIAMIYFDIYIYIYLLRNTNRELQALRQSNWIYPLHTCWRGLRRAIFAFLLYPSLGLARLLLCNISHGSLFAL